jgi:hypothetical protein
MEETIEKLCAMLDEGSISAAEALSVDQEYAGQQNEIAKLRFENLRLRDALETIDRVLSALRKESAV